MDAVAILSWILFYLVAKTNTVPPDVCFQNFRWQDCGMAPTPVIYYYKAGSRCEVGMWRGCLPNPNMFTDEYECVQTCVFAVRARPEDWHNHNAIDYPVDDAAEPPANDTDVTPGVGGSEGGTVGTEATPMPGDTDQGTTTVSDNDTMTELQGGDDPITTALPGNDQTIEPTNETPTGWTTEHSDDTTTDVTET